MAEGAAFEMGRLYLPIRQIADVLTASQKDIFVRLPGLIGYWPMGIRGASGGVVDHSGVGNLLSQTGVCPVGYDGNAYSHLGGGTNYLGVGGVLNVSGTETWIDASIRGLTVGGWVSIDGLPGVQAGIVGKFGSVTEYSYAIAILSTGIVQMVISSTGSDTPAASSAVVGTGQWVFIVGRFVPSAEISIHINSVKVSNTTGIPASLNPSVQAFEVGRYLNSDSYIAHCRVRDVFICACALTDAQIEELRQTSVP